MNFRSFEDMAETVRRNLSRIPPDIDVVVGIPRSGIFPASMIALHRNVVLTDVEGLVEGRALRHGIRRDKPGIKADADDWKNVLIVDDSVLSGRTFDDVRRRLAEAGGSWNVISCAVYGASLSHPKVDIVLEDCPRPRVFEWNLMHHPEHLEKACLDIDGVLCLDPSEEENDDGPAYEAFLKNAKPYLIPTVPVGAVVSSRLEKHRRVTEEWLRRHGVQYGALHLLNLPTGEERRRLRAHVPFKSETYGNKSDFWLFIESEPEQAKGIAVATGKAVICTSNMILYDEAGATKFRRSLTVRSQRFSERLRRKVGRVLRSLKSS